MPGVTILVHGAASASVVAEDPQPAPDAVPAAEDGASKPSEDKAQDQTVAQKKARVK